jgi:hypothetical protein
MNQRIEELTEALAGVMIEHKALQGYAVDFINAYNSKDVVGMLNALRGSLRLYILRLQDFNIDKKDLKVMNALRDLMRAHTNLENMVPTENAKHRNKRRR